MDEIKAIEKSISELKTIQNRLKKVLNEREWALSIEIPRLNSLIDEKDAEYKAVQARLDSLENELTLLNEKLRDTTSTLHESQRDQQQAEKETESLKAEIRELKSDYVYRSMMAKNQFLEEKLDQLKGKLKLQERAATGNFKVFENLAAQYRNTLGLEIERLERRNKELERMNDELLKENIGLRKV